MCTPSEIGSRRWRSQNKLGDGERASFPGPEGRVLTGPSGDRARLTLDQLVKVRIRGSDFRTEARAGAGRG